MSKLCQLYDEQGFPIAGQGGAKEDIFKKGLLHGAAHVWIWRNTSSGKEILLQKRAKNKMTWPNCYDISAAGHIDVSEEPIAAAIRESEEEITLNITKTDLRFIGIFRAFLTTPEGKIENEFQWLYLLELKEEASFKLEKSEVDSLQWMTLSDFESSYKGDNFVGHGDIYYQTVISAVEVL